MSGVDHLNIVKCDKCNSPFQLGWDRLRVIYFHENRAIRECFWSVLKVMTCRTCHTKHPILCSVFLGRGWRNSYSQWEHWTVSWFIKCGIKYIQLRKFKVILQIDRTSKYFNTKNLCWQISLEMPCGFQWRDLATDVLFKIKYQIKQAMRVKIRKQNEERLTNLPVALWPPSFSHKFGSITE